MSKIAVCKTCEKEVAKSAKVCPHCGAKLKGGKLKFIISGFIALIIIIIAIGSSQGSDSSSTSTTTKNDKKSVTFCKKVDKDLKAIEENDKFSVGTVTVRLQASKAFGTDKIKVTIYKVDEAAESIYDSANNEVNPDWSVIAIPINFTDPGKYRVDFTTNGKDKLGSGTVTIQ